MQEEILLHGVECKLRVVSRETWGRSRRSWRGVVETIGGGSGCMKAATVRGAEAVRGAVVILAAC